MTKIDFYVLEEERPKEGFLFTCRLIEKIYRQGHRVYVYSENQAQIDKLDQLLWSFKAESFIPHSQHINQTDTLTATEQSLASKAPSANEQPLAHQAPLNEVLLGTCPPPSHYHSCLINLSENVPSFFSRFQRLGEVVLNNERRRNISRNNYRFYQQRGYAIDTHKIAQ